MKARIFSSLSIFVALAVLVGFYGCGLNVPDDTKQLTLTGPTTLSIGSQPAVGDFCATALNNSNVFTDRGKDWGTSPVLPYTWSVLYQKDGQWVKLIEDYSAANYQVKFYKPGKYLVIVDLRQGFGSGVIVNSEVGTGKQIEVNISQGSGYSSANFTPGLIISTSTGAAVLTMTEIKVIRDWGTAITYNPLPVDNTPADTGGRAGNAILSFDQSEGLRGGQMTATLSVEGLLDNLSVSGVYFDTTLLTLRSIEAVSGSGWSVSGRGSGISFTASNGKPQSAKVASFKIVFDAKDVTGVTGITWSSATISGSYNKEIVSLQTVDGFARVK